MITNNWYKEIKANSLNKEADMGLEDWKKGLMWGAGMGLVPLSVGLMNNPDKKDFPQQSIKIESPHAQENKKNAYTTKQTSKAVSKRTTERQGTTSSYNN